jgi:hypothetical protein
MHNSQPFQQAAIAHWALIISSAITHALTQIMAASRPA